MPPQSRFRCGSAWQKCSQHNPSRISNPRPTVSLLVGSGNESVRERWKGVGGRGGGYGEEEGKKGGKATLNDSNPYATPNSGIGCTRNVGFGCTRKFTSMEGRHAVACVCDHPERRHAVACVCDHPERRHAAACACDHPREKACCSMCVCDHPREENYGSLHT